MSGLHDFAQRGGLDAMMNKLGAQARAAAAVVREAPAEARTAALKAIAQHLREAAPAILAANAEDVRDGRAAGLSEAFVDRLALDAARVEAIAHAIDETAAFPDPVGTVLAEWTRPNGLRFQRVRTPIGAIGVIFESRPNVAADAGALCLRAGNVAVLRGGSDSVRSVAAIGAALGAGLKDAGLPEDAIQIVPSADRKAVGLMLQGLNGALDVIVPRGGKSLVARVQAEARVPVFAHLEGVCHTYVHAAADPGKAVDLVVNGKMRRVSVCGATETLLIDRAVAKSLLPRIADALRAAGCELRGDEEACAIVNCLDREPSGSPSLARPGEPEGSRSVVSMKPAVEDDWRTEYLAPILALRVVSGIDEAVAHIARYGTSHTECIVTEDADAAEQFCKRVDSAIVLVNASTQFADGGEFGFGGEIGIATGRLHARGPVGAEQLTTFRYVVRGDGQIRP